MTSPIPLAHATPDEADITAALRVLRSGRLVQGPEVAAFETEFAALVDGRECVAVNSGTSALWLSLLALGIGPGNEVVLPAFTFAGTAAAVRLTGAACVFADIDPRTFCLDAAAAAAAVGPRTAALLPVHLYGHPAAMHDLVPLARRHGLALVEDAAQAHDAALDGRPVGGFGDAAAFSFYPTKNMQAVEGGLVATAGPELAGALRLLRNHGAQERYRHERVGTNARMSDVNAAIARSQLRRLDERTTIRRRNADRLDAALADVPGVITAWTAPGARHVRHQYTIRVREAALSRDEFARALSALGIGNAVHYPVPLHRSPAYRDALDLPHTDRAAAEVLSLPVHPHLSESDLDRIAGAVTALARGKKATT
ncbi:DegT/DnrJ/EryC1/StrS aminotransferase family protein [Streptomyces sp. SID3343]|uniref:aminotransferase class I/II-fold pyridoxal phosphate-dependent enzyme n=1 Tax=Streptomyces sp. SID3343 TaxID=2690260 RepID=UPI001368F72D|nr:aminotransferase class I/II-fold pyridoxal phosphate-dependent enzyme [Streptomyces sp. SID3343]